jgi:hypothetical protein
MVSGRAPANLARGSKDKENLNNAVAVIGIDIGKNSLHMLKGRCHCADDRFAKPVLMMGYLLGSNDCLNVTKAESRSRRTDRSRCSAAEAASFAYLSLVSRLPFQSSFTLVPVNPLFVLFVLSWLQQLNFGNSALKARQVCSSLAAQAPI